MAKVLVACEESQEVCKAFRERGHEAYSCDIQVCSGGHPEWHIMDDVLKYINGYCQFFTRGGSGYTLILNGICSLPILHARILPSVVLDGFQRSRKISGSRRVVCSLCR